MMEKTIRGKKTENLLIKGAMLIDPAIKLEKRGDILIEKGKIVRLGKIAQAPEGVQVIDARELVITPGWMDMHVHFRQPGREDEETVESGAAAAVAGGFTAASPMPNTTPAADTREVIEFLIEEGRKTLIDVFPIAAATKGREGKELSEMAELVEAGAVAFSDDGCAIATARLARRAMEYASMFDVPIIEHAEEPTLTVAGAMNEGKYSTRLGLGGMPTVAEDIIVARDILLAEYTGAHVHIAHISSARSIDLVRQAKIHGVRVTCEVTPHHFALTDEAVSDYDANTKMNPPLRSQKDIDAVLEGLQDGTIDAIATDHAPHAPEEKDVEFAAAPFGIVGLETALGLIVTKLMKAGVLSLSEAVDKVAVQPRRILSLPPVTLQEGQIANLTFFSPERVWTVAKNAFYSKCRNTPFNGWELTGKVYGVYNKRQLWLNKDF
jgi:dihydroorotase